MSANKGPAIVALDVSSTSEALGLVEAVSGLAGMLKVGHQLFMAEGPAVVSQIVERGERVFLDLKFHDIPNTVARAALEAARLGVSMMTLHGLRRRRDDRCDSSGAGGLFRREPPSRSRRDRPDEHRSRHACSHRC